MGIRTLCIEGNGLASVHALGALEYMRNGDLLKDLKDIYCFSFGALIAMTYCVHGSFNPLLVHMQSGYIRRRCMRLHAMLKLSVVCPALRHFNNDILRRTIRDILPCDVHKLGDLQRISGIRVHILVCSTDTLTTKVFNSSRHCNLDLVDVLSASCAIPFIFNPVQVCGESFIDGGVYSGMSHIKTQGRGSDTVLIGASSNTALQYGINCFEQLWGVLLKVQKMRFQRRAHGVRIVNIPLMRGVLLYASTATMRRMYENGARIASAEFALPLTSLSVAHMRCCGVTAYTVMIPLPATQHHAHLMDVLRKCGVGIVHKHETEMTWAKSICFCGCMRICWSE